MSDQELRAAIAARIRAEVEPLLEERPHDGGYNCCGCSTYWWIYEHCLSIVEDRPISGD